MAESENTLDFSKVQHELDILNRALTDYFLVRFPKMTLPEVVQKVGNDVRIQVYRGFRKYRFKGKDIAFRELRRRTRAGQGTFVRSKVLSNFAPTTDKRGRKLSKWQRLVYQEVSKRQSGVGVLAVAFLDRRWRSRKAANGQVQNFLVEQKSSQLGTLARIIASDKRYTIEGHAEGMATVAQRYGILESAVRDGTANLNQYLDRKFNEALTQAFGRRR